MARQADRRINLAVARAIPGVLFGIIIYSCYAITKPLCIDYLINPLPKYDRPSRIGAAAPILVVFYILLLFVIITYLRLLDNVVWNPDLLPRSAVADQQSTHSRQSQDRSRRKRKGHRHRKSKGDELSDKPTGDVERALDYNAGPIMLPWDTAGLEYFYKKDVFTGDVNPHWTIGLGLSGFFGIFTVGMTLSSLQLAAFNLTTIENLNRRSAVWSLAIRVPSHLLRSRWAPTFRTITYPLPPVPPIPPPMPTQSAPGEGNQPPQHAPPPPPPPPPPADPSEQHVFAILQTLPGENPFALGSPLKNLQQILGHSIIDWLLPIKRSPCVDHSNAESEFAMGPVVTRLKKEAGLEPTINTQNNDDTSADEPTNDQPKRKRRRGKHHHHHHHQYPPMAETT
ncbi:uncharacterized protein DSM5745_07649 [Aspergillus mulundensis]|uniref:Uncharacterized protein n=1 Tax=Aspergillus mulundensis TaxID=1810919 RepID=A0A3D8REJ7_9EURO|nr:hypothetical protein DSM5745_07649 [Aspergillus mulundensis]RDW72477.1 hypothetical protein DSM5745_07649 [Aspergillus mulundensis]